MSNPLNTPKTEEPKKEKVDVLAKLKAGFEGIAKNFSQNGRKKLLRLMILLVAVLFVTNPGMIPFLPQDIKNTLTGTITGMFGNVTDVSGMISLNWVVLFKLVVMVIVLQIANIVCGSLLEAVNSKSNRGKTIKHLLLSGFSYLVGIVGIFWALSILGVDLATLFASLGILALIIGFGAESLIADMGTGMFMIFENEYNVGDIIKISGYRGTVTSIGIRTTGVTDAGGNVKVFNNSDMRNIVSLSSMTSTAVCDFSIPYEMKIADAEKALEVVLKEVQAANPEVFEEMPRYGTFSQFSMGERSYRLESNDPQLRFFWNRTSPVGLEMEAYLYISHIANGRRDWTTTLLVQEVPFEQARDEDSQLDTVITLSDGSRLYLRFQDAWPTGDFSLSERATLIMDALTASPADPNGWGQVWICDLMTTPLSENWDGNEMVVDENYRFHYFNRVEDRDLGV